MLNTFLHIWSKILESNFFNFVLMLVLLNWIMKKCNMSEKLEQGRKSIEDKINASKQAKQDAINELYELQEKTKEVDKEVHSILEKTNENAIMVGEKIVNDAKKQAGEFSKNLDKIVESNRVATQNGLTEKTAKTAIKIAQNYIEDKLEQDKSLHIKFINESINALDGVEF